MTKEQLRHILSQHINFTNFHWLADRQTIELDGKEYDFRSLVLLAWTPIKISSDKHALQTCQQTMCCSPGHLIYLPKKYDAQHLKRAKAKAERDGQQLSIEHLEWAATPKERVSQRKLDPAPKTEAETLSAKEAARLERNRRALIYYRERLARMTDDELKEYRTREAARKREYLREKKAALLQSENS